MDAKRVKQSIILAVSVILVIILVLVIGKLIDKYTPSKEQQDLWEYYGLTEESQAAIVLNHEVISQKAVIREGIVYLSYETVRDVFNSRFYWDYNENLLLYTTPEDVVSAAADSKEYFVTKDKKSENYTIVYADANTAYIAMDYVKKYTDLDYEFFEEPNRVVVRTKWEDEPGVFVKKDTQIRYRGGIKSPILTEVFKETELTVLEKGEDWDKVATNEGVIGYIRKKRLGKEEVKTFEHTPMTETFSHILKDKKINMAWHQVGGYIGADGFQQAMQGVSGVNTIAPTWFFMSDNDGNIVSYATHEYVQKAHEMGIEVWGLVQNMDYDISSYQILSRMASRENLVNQLISKALEYDLDGINVDIEELSNDAEDGYIQFIRELSIQCRKHGLVLSIDNYVPTAFTSHYNRKEQGIVADYIVIMGYDEHYAGVAEAGSTASIEFVKNGIIKTLEEVPKEKVINGIPFYTRVFKQIPENVAKEGQEGVLIEDTNSELGRYLLDSEAVPMGKAERLLQENGVNPIWNDALGQYYGEYMKDGIKYLIWLEEEESIGLKMKLIKDYELAGVAEWSLGLAKNTIWEVIRSYLE